MPFEREVCTSDRPMPKGAPGHWYHPEATAVDECSQGCCDIYECPVCGHRWRVEGGD